MKKLRILILAILIASLPLAAQTSGASATANAGQTATFSVTNDGTSPFTYQWQKNGSPITGATSATLVIAPVSATDAGSYTVVVSNPAGSVTSTAAVLTVISKPTTAAASVSVK